MLKELITIIATTAIVWGQAPAASAPKYVPFPEVLTLKLNALDKEKAAIRRPLEEAYELATRPHELQQAMLLRQACLAAGAAIAADEPLVQTDPSAAILTAGNCKVDMRRHTIAVAPAADTGKSGEPTRSETPSAKTPPKTEARKQ